MLKIAHAQRTHGQTGESSPYKADYSISMHGDTARPQGAVCMVPLYGASVW